MQGSQSESWRASTLTWVFVSVVTAAVGYLWGYPFLAALLRPPSSGASKGNSFQPGQLVILVRNAHQEAVGYAIVEFLDSEGHLQAGPFKADSVGRVLVDGGGLPEGVPLTVRCSAGPLEVSMPVNKAVGGSMTLLLPESFPARGHVVFSDGRTPVPDALVSCRGHVTRTGPQGEFVLAIVPDRQFLDGSVRLQVQAEGRTEKSFRIPCVRAKGDLTLSLD